ncbi:hypothetical protein [Muricoccus radiodurans]|uniref:hypothetical protein n=1 Tax=Muricoccus radiodurans TaxID=2231721 RepID=UPI003CF4271E
MGSPRLAASLALLAALAAGPSEAQTGPRRFFQVAPGPPLAAAPTPPPAPALNQREAIRRWLCPNGGTPMRGRPGRCDGRGRVPMPRGGGGGGTDPDSEVAGWHNDLPPPSRRQIPCPPGTVASEARANPGTVRCVPG